MCGSSATTGAGYIAATAAVAASLEAVACAPAVKQL